MTALQILSSRYVWHASGIGLLFMSHEIGSVRIDLMLPRVSGAPDHKLAVTLRAPMTDAFDNVSRFIKRDARDIYL